MGQLLRKTRMEEEKGRERQKETKRLQVLSLIFTNK